MTDVDSIDLARAEQERRRRERLRVFPRYGPWLESVSPAMRWDWTWLRYVQSHYDLVTSGDIRRLMILAPPQHGKSEGGTIRYPVYRLERDPTTRCIVSAHSQRLANKFSRKSRNIAQHRINLSSDRKAVEEWETSSGGGLRAVGVGGSIAGTPADLAFIDDPIRNRKEANSLVVRDAIWDWYCDDLLTRVQESGAIVLQMTHWHEDDVAGRILNSEEAQSWTVIRLAALAEENDPLGRAVGEALCPERFSRETLLERQRTMRLSFEALYQQRPVPKSGEFFLREWFKIVDFGPKEPVERLVARYRHWDLAATDGDGDYTVGVLMCKTANGMFFIEDVIRFRLNPTDRDRKIREVAEKDPPGTRYSGEQEPGAGGKTAAQAFCRLLAGFSVTTTPAASEGSKLLRAEDYASQLGADAVRLIRGKWNAAFIQEHVEAPYGKHDDQWDAAAGAFNRLAAKRLSKAT